MRSAPHAPESGASPRIVIADARVVVGAGGGPDKTIVNSARYLDPAGYRNLCIYLHPPGDQGFEQIRRKAEANDAPVIAVPDRGPLDWRVVSRLVQVCRHENVAIWHGHDYKTNVLGLLLKRFWPMRLVTTVHGWVHYTRRTALYYWLDRLSLRFYEKVICVSEDLYRACRACSVPRERLMLLENGIDLDDYRRLRTREESKRLLGFDPSRPLVGAGGRLSAEKGFDVLIYAAHQLMSDGIEFDLIIVGDGDEKSALEGLIASLGRRNRIRLLGYRSDLPELYQALDVFALSSYREGLPNVLLEAMATEVPVVATKVNGVPRLVRHSTNGLLVEPGSVVDLAAALKRLLVDRGLRDELARAGRQTVEESFSFATRMDKARRLYDQLLGRHNGNGERE
jgi:glycosyltransferase involved in cell wall biosynthesis